MVRMQMGGGEDMRDKTVCDPCVGTGRMLLCASNYSCRLYGVDILHNMVTATTLNLFLYAPWGAKPFPWFEGSSGIDQKNSLCDTEDEAKANVAPVEVQEQLQLF